MKTELWNGREIRFVEKAPGEWWAVNDDDIHSLGMHVSEVVYQQTKPV